ncbi:MAG: hypothetical protein KKD28_06750 [Chloroflexi bacterium]|nr:hypothetical protein [Chloroflexota bacterium]MBU1661155.1 hypothetical protein [Chloroflexota bacterium]
MSSSTSPNVSPIIQPWSGKDWVISAINLFFLLLVGGCGVLLLFTLFVKGDLDGVKTQAIVVGIAYIYSLAFATISTRGIDRAEPKGNITQAVSYCAIGYYIGVGIVYGIVIVKLAERDYETDRFLVYAIILAGCVIAALAYSLLSEMKDLPRVLRFIVSTPPKITMLQLLGLVILFMGVLHLVSIVSQYFIGRPAGLDFLLYDLIVLICMNMVGAYLLIRPEIEKRRNTE